jgi:hypothetical protein
MLVTAEMLLENSKKINNEERKKVKIHIKELNGEIECELLNKEDYLDLILSKEKDKDLEVIYNSCPIFRDDELIDNLGCKSKPTQVVAKVLKDPTIYKLADFILIASGYGDRDLVSLAEETKN